MNFEYILKCVEDTKNMAKDIAPFIKNNIIFLNGEIGAGKTTFTKYLVEIYGLNDEVCSPTFSLENRYNTKNGLIIHFDFLSHAEKGINLQVNFLFYQPEPY